MPWFRVDDGFPDHPKLETLASRPLDYVLAIAVWVLMGADCMKAGRRTDGKVSPERLARVVPLPKNMRFRAASLLVECGLWFRRDGGWVYHDWDDYQPTAEEIAADTKAATIRQKRWRLKQKEAQRREGVDASTNGSTNASTNALVDASRDALVDASVTPSVTPCVDDLLRARPRSPLPSRPLPTPAERTIVRVDQSAHAGSPAALGGEAEQSLTVGGAVQSGLEARLQARGAGLPTWTAANRAHRDTIAAWLVQNHPSDPFAACDRLLDGWFADPWTAQEGFPLGDLANRPGKYFAGLVEPLESLKQRARERLRAQDVKGYMDLMAQYEARARVEGASV